MPYAIARKPYSYSMSRKYQEKYRTDIILPSSRCFGNVDSESMIVRFASRSVIESCEGETITSTPEQAHRIGPSADRASVSAIWAAALWFLGVTCPARSL
jgi:hypothetical protein